MSRRVPATKPNQESRINNATARWAEVIYPFAILTFTFLETVQPHLWCRRLFLYPTRISIRLHSHIPLEPFQSRTPNPRGLIPQLFQKEGDLGIYPLRFCGFEARRKKHPPCNICLALFGGSPRRPSTSSDRLT